MLVTWCLQHLRLKFAVALSPILTSTVYSVTAFTHLQPVVHFTTHWVLLVSCSSSPRVPASHGGCSPSWIPELSPSHSRSNTWLTVHLTGTLSNNYFIGSLVHNNSLAFFVQLTDILALGLVTTKALLLTCITKRERPSSSLYCCVENAFALQLPYLLLQSSVAKVICCYAISIEPLLLLGGRGRICWTFIFFICKAPVLCCSSTWFQCGLTLINDNIQIVCNFMLHAAKYLERSREMYRWAAWTNIPWSPQTVFLRF
jgi:hypothetical protein